MARNSKTATASASIEAIASVSNVPVVIDTSWEDMGAFDYAASIDIGKATSEHIAALKVTARDDEKLLAVQKRYYVGAFAKGCDVAREVAVARLALASSKHKTATDKRTDAEDLIYQAAKTTWSRACDKAGLPQIKIGGNGPRGPKASTNDSNTPVDIASFVVPSNLDCASMVQLAGAIDALFSRAMNANATRITGRTGAVLRKLQTDLTESVQDAARAHGQDVAEAEALKSAPKTLRASAKVEPDETKAALLMMKAELAAAREREAKQAAILEKLMAKIAA